MWLFASWAMKKWDTVAVVFFKIRMGGRDCGNKQQVIADTLWKWTHWAFTSCLHRTHTFVSTEVHTHLLALDIEVGNDVKWHNVIFSSGDLPSRCFEVGQTGASSHHSCWCGLYSGQFQRLEKMLETPKFTSLTDRVAHFRSGGRPANFAYTYDKTMCVSNNEPTCNHFHQLRFP